MAQCTTDFIDQLLLRGGGVKDIHKKIIDRQNQSGSKGYHSHGYFFNKSGNIQQRTLFGHIAHLILDKSSAIKLGEQYFNESTLDSLRNSERTDLNKMYENNETIQLVIFNGREVPLCISPFEKAQNIEQGSYLPSRKDIEKAYNKLTSTEEEEVKIEYLINQIEDDCLEQNKKLEAGWRGKIKIKISSNLIEQAGKE